MIFLIWAQNPLQLGHFGGSSHANVLLTSKHGVGGIQESWDITSYQVTFVKCVNGNPLLDSFCFSLVIRRGKGKSPI